MLNLNWINISLNSRGWKCEYKPSGWKKTISKTYSRRYRRYEALSCFKDYIKEQMSS